MVTMEIEWKLGVWPHAEGVTSLFQNPNQDAVMLFSRRLEGSLEDTFFVTWGNIIYSWRWRDVKRLEIWVE